MKGLNLVLSIYMGSSFGEVVEGWANIKGGKFLCATFGAKFIYVVDYGFMAPFLLTLEELVTPNNLCNSLI
jgi:hypothetical protein